MSEEELAQYNYALPYIFLPRVQEEPKSDTVANVVTEVNGKGATFEFDWAMDDVDVRKPLSRHSYVAHTPYAPKAAFRFRQVKRKEEIQERNNNGDP